MRWVLSTAFVVLAACSTKPTETPAKTEAAPPSPAAAAITADGLLSHIKVLSSDEFEGRAPGSKGEDLTVAYLEKQFKDLGLAPGNPDGTYIQKVPLAGITSAATASARVGGK